MLTAKRFFPKVSPHAVKAMGFGVFVCVLMLFAYFGKPTAAGIGSFMVHLVPHLAIAAWAMVFLHFAIQVQANKKRIEDLEARLGSPEIPKINEAPQLPSMMVTPHSKPSSALFDPRALHAEIMRAMYRKRKLSPLNVEYTHIRAGNSCFVETCPKDFSETWLAQEIEDVSIERRVRDEIGLVSTLIEDGQESRHKKVVVIVVVNRDLGVSEKASLMGQLETIKSEDHLSEKMSFRVWDKRDLNS